MTLQKRYRFSLVMDPLLEGSEEGSRYPSGLVPPPSQLESLASFAWAEAGRSAWPKQRRGWHGFGLHARWFDYHIVLGPPVGRYHWGTLPPKVPWAYRVSNSTVGRLE